VARRLAPTDVGGLGFGLKWDMGWMHDTLEYFAQDPIYRRYHHGELTFRSIYAFTENFVLPLSTTRSSTARAHAQQDARRRMAAVRRPPAPLRLPVLASRKKLLFQGDELGTRAEWNHDEGLDWGCSRTGERGARPMGGRLEQAGACPRSAP